jgi:DNA-binding XRE family transcriptional regulator
VTCAERACTLVEPIAIFMDVNFPLLVREIRQARRITQEELARELQVTFSTVNGWEKHEPIPSLASRLVEVAEKSGIMPKAVENRVIGQARPKRRRPRR